MHSPVALTSFSDARACCKVAVSTHIYFIKVYLVKALDWQVQLRRALVESLVLHYLLCYHGLIRSQLD